MYSASQHSHPVGPFDTLLFRKDFQKRADEIHAVLPPCDSSALLSLRDLKGTLPQAIFRVLRTRRCINFDFEITEVFSDRLVRKTNGNRKREGFDPSSQGLYQRREVFSESGIIKHWTRARRKDGGRGRKFVPSDPQHFACRADPSVRFFSPYVPEAKTIRNIEVLSVYPRGQNNP
ncbi:hypothetical protein K438DRAFT_1929679 [Mycena galopus ATCC 62051]|nr:hypothetical protein K438DRAFT_1929679 [Mycena galopus ATCC 62051]